MTDCQKFEAALAETPELERLPRTARDHASRCVRCARMLADFHAIVAQARALAAPEPPPEMWERIQGQLRAEGIIREGDRAESEAASTAPHLAQS
ncbi:MAG: hypothetical protein ACRD17_05435 [Terriglobales bacterium]